MIETKTYADGTVATGVAPLPPQSPAEQEASIAHRADYHAQMHYPDGRVPWRDARAPDLSAGWDQGSLMSCEYCGSMHPADVAAAIRAGATGTWADWKYGWPHKAYFDGIPNPHAGLSEVTASVYQDQAPAGDGWHEIREPRFCERTGARLPDRIKWVQRSMASHVTDGKFYTVHLQDASPEDRETIERHLGLRFTFTDTQVSWTPFDAAAPTT